MLFPFVISADSCALAHSASRASLVLAMLLAAACGSPTTTPPPEGANVIALVSGDGQHARLTRELPQLIVVVVRNASGSTVSGASVVFTPSSGSVSPSAATTDATGRASVRWTLGTSVGAQTLAVRLASGTGSPLTIAATADPAMVVTIQAVDGDRQQAVVGTSVGVAPSVVVRDALGAPASALGLRFAVTAGGGTVGSAVVTTDANGRASAGGWTLGSLAGENALSVTPADGDVVAATPTVFSAVGVGVGGIVSTPMRSYLLIASGATTVQDSVTGLRFTFPAGAHGTLEVARVLTGPAAPWSGATRFRATFSGSDVWEVATRKAPGGEVQAFMYCDLIEPVADNVTSLRWWGVPRSRVVGDSVFFFLQSSGGSYPGSVMTQSFFAPAPQRSIMGPASVFASGIGSPVVQAYAVVPIETTAGFAAYDLYRQAVTQAILWWLATLPSDEAARTSRAVDAHNPTITVGERATPDDDRSYYLYTSSWGRAYPLFFFDTVNAPYRERSTRHEVGHYLSHMMLGDAAYQTLVANGPDGSHDPGKIARGFRGSLSEEYAYAAQFFMSGNLDNYDLRAVGATGSQSGVREMMLPYRPNSVDFPSLEGFGAAMLAAFTRTDDDTLVYDFSAEGHRSRSPALGLSVGTMLGVLAKGPQNPNQLRTMLVPLAGSQEMLAALFEPIGWSYWSTGHVVDALGQPVVGATVRSVIKVNGVEYATPASTPALSPGGAFILQRLYPLTSTLRVYIPNGSRIDSVDAKEFTVPWDTPTNTPQALGDLVVINMSMYNDIQISTSGWTSPNTLGADACKPNFDILQEMSTAEWNSYVHFPLIWNGNRFSASGSVNYSGTAGGGYPDRHSESMSVSGTVTLVRGDSIWVSVTASRSTLAEELIPAPSGATWQRVVHETSSLTLGSMGLGSNGPTPPAPATYRATLNGAAAFGVLSGTVSWFNQSSLIPTFHPYSCTAYSLSPTNAQVRVTLRVRPP